MKLVKNIFKQYDKLVLKKVLFVDNHKKMIKIKCLIGYKEKGLSEKIAVLKFKKTKSHEFTFKICDSILIKANQIIQR